MKVKHLLKKEDFDNVFKKGKKFQGETIEAYIQKSGQEDIYIGVAIAKKIEPTAVRRNLLKRLVYAYFRDCKSMAAPGVKAVVRFYKKNKETKRKDLSSAVRTELESVLSRAGIKK